MGTIPHLIVRFPRMAHHPSFVEAVGEEVLHAPLGEGLPLSIPVSLGVKPVGQGLIGVLA